MYQSHETSPIVISKRHHPANANPLVFKRTCLFRFADRESSEAAMQSRVLTELREAGGEVSVQLYGRVPRRNALPAGLGKLIAERDLMGSILGSPVEPPAEWLRRECGAEQPRPREGGHLR